MLGQELKATDLNKDNKKQRKTQYDFLIHSGAEYEHLSASGGG